MQMAGHTLSHQKASARSWAFLYPSTSHSFISFWALVVSTRGMALLLAGRQPNIRMPDGEAETDQALANKGAAVPCRSAPLSATHPEWDAEGQGREFFHSYLPAILLSARQRPRHGFLPIRQKRSAAREPAVSANNHAVRSVNENSIVT